jgi:hypothetical protein
VVVWVVLPLALVFVVIAVLADRRLSLLENLPVAVVGRVVVASFGGGRE